MTDDDLERGGFSAAADIMPKNFDLSQIEKALRQIEHEPSMITNYFTSLRLKFNARQQIKIIESLEARYLAAAKVQRAKKTMLQSEKARILAEEDLKTIEVDIEYRQRGKEKRLLEIKKEIADLEQTEVKKTSHRNRTEDEIACEVVNKRKNRAALRAKLKEENPEMADEIDTIFENLFVEL